MKNVDKNHIISTVFRTNTLPISSLCNTSCIFCSHKQNPEGVEVFRLGELELEDYREFISFLSPDRKIVIGESATRIIEGEPFLNRNIIDILRLIRIKTRHTPIQITTNGILLDAEIIDSLVGLGNISLNISINCINASKRKIILGTKGSVNIKTRLELLKGRIPFSGSFVVVPGVLDLNDMAEIIKVLNDSGAEMVRAFLPGYTYMAKNSFDLFSLYRETVQIIEKLAEDYDIPVIIEPSIITDLDSRVEGVIRDTPAHKAGLMKGDIIIQINGCTVESRVDAFDRAFRSTNPVITVRRGCELVSLKLLKARNSTPGFIVLYDVDPEIVGQLNTLSNMHRARNVLFVTSELAAPILGRLFERGGLSFTYDILTAKNLYFGGTIKCAGLLTVSDIIHAVGEYLLQSGKPDLMVLPPLMFDHKRQDLLGRSIMEIEEAFSMPVDIT